MELSFTRVTAFSALWPARSAPARAASAAPKAAASARRRSFLVLKTNFIGPYEVSVIRAFAQPLFDHLRVSPDMDRYEEVHQLAAAYPLFDILDESFIGGGIAAGDDVVEGVDALEDGDLVPAQLEGLALPGKSRITCPSPGLSCSPVPPAAARPPLPRRLRPS